MFTKARARWGAAWIACVEIEPPFEWPSRIGGLARRGVEHREQVPHVGVPGVERRVLGIAVAALIPRHDAVAPRGEERGEHVEGAREVEAAVGAHNHGRALVPPLGDGELHPIRFDAAPPCRALCARELGGGDLVGRGRSLRIGTFQRRFSRSVFAAESTDSQRASPPAARNARRSAGSGASTRKVRPPRSSPSSAAWSSTRAAALGAPGWYAGP